MTTLSNLQRNEAVWQADFTSARDENGQWTASRSFICHELDVHILMPIKGDPSNKAGWELLKLVSLTTSEIVGSEWVKVMCSYRGTQYEFDGDEGEDLEPTYHNSTVSQSEPIESHEIFEDITAAEWTHAQWYKDSKIIRDTTDATKFKLSAYDEETNKWTYSEDFEPSETLLKLFENYDRGFTSYFAKRSTHMMRYSSNKPLTAATMNAIAKIDTPPNAPPIGGEFSWLFMGANEDQSGDVHEVELEWLLGKWDEEYYT